MQLEVVGEAKEVGQLLSRKTGHPEVGRMMGRLCLKPA